MSWAGRSSLTDSANVEHDFQVELFVAIALFGYNNIFGVRTVLHEPWALKSRSHS